MIRRVSSKGMCQSLRLSLFCGSALLASWLSLSASAD
jgi:hypothetical protein